MSRLLEFYRGMTPDSQGRHLAEIWQFDDDSLEAIHDFIQWLFPLPERSRFNSAAPQLTPGDIAAFQKDELLRNNLQRSYERFLSFLGLAIQADGSVVEAANFAARAADVWASQNHNWLRITRLLRSLRLLGLEPAARALYDRLRLLQEKFSIPNDTVQFWTEAVENRPFHA